MSYEKLDQFINLLKKYQEADLDAVIATTGKKGMGKSSFSIQAARKYLDKYMGVKYFDPDKYIAYDNSDVQKKLFDLEEGSPLICDEAARFAMGEDWNKAESKSIKKILAQIRRRHLLIFLNIPEFTWLDKKYRDELVTHWAWIPTREKCILFEPNSNPGVSDVWHLREMQKKGGYISKFTDPNKVLHIAAKNPCFRDSLMFPKVPNDIYERYVALRDKYTHARQGENYVSQKETAKIMVYNLKEKFNNFVDAVELSRLGKPTNKLICDYLLSHPIDNNSIVEQNTVRVWYNEIKEKLRGAGNNEQRTD